jgi:hypothetical protein
VILRKMEVLAMNNVSLLEEMLKNYSHSSKRIVFLENQKKLLCQKPNDGLCVSGTNSSRDTEILVNEFSEKMSKMEGELEKLKYFKNIIDLCLKMINDMDEKYNIIIYKYYILNVRMEDIAAMLHISRSRCYSLCKEAIVEMSKIVFGNFINPN